MFIYNMINIERANIYSEKRLILEEKEMAESNVRQKVKFNISGDFCPNCSAKMERALSQEEGIGETAINYAAKTVFLPSEKADLAEKIMNQIEPGIKLVPVVPEKGGLDDQEDELAKIKLARIVIALILLTIGIIFESQWHASTMVFTEYGVFLTAYLLVGYEVLSQAFRNIFRGSVFDENFLMAIATLGAIGIHQMPEAVGVMLFFSVGEYIQDRAVDRSRGSIQALLDIRPDYANLIDQLETKKVNPQEVRIGQEILVRPGERVPLDGEVTQGNSFLDTSALTGESVPRRVEKGDAVLAGMVNTTGVLTLRVLREFSESSVQKILDLVENAGARKARTEKFITTFARYYTPGVVSIALGIALIPPLFLGAAFGDWLYRALTILVISCPCALVISVPLGYFGGIGGASRHGILVKGANFLEALTNVKTVVFDKTGTLTEGVFEVVAVNPYNISREALLEIAAAAEIHSNHPIAQSIRNRHGQNPAIDQVENQVENYEEITGKGIKANIRDHEVFVGKASLLQENGIAIPEEKIVRQAGTIVHVSIDGGYAGYLLIADRIKQDSRDTIQSLKKAGINTVMLTGDHESAAEIMAGELGVNTFYADLLPEDKVALLEKIMQEGKNKAKTIYVGDGINDAPVLSRADIGVAMGGLGSDAAIEAADVVLMEDEPKKLLSALSIAKYTKKIIWQNIGFALIIKLGFIVLGMFGAATMWEAVFADVGVALLAVLNATRVWRHSVK